MTKSIGIKYGIFAGLGVLLYFLVFYFVNPRTMLGLGVSWSSLVVYIIAMILAVREQKQQTEGGLEFRSALRTAFQVVVVANAIFYLAYYLVMQVDPALLQTLKEVSMEYYQQALPNADAAELEKNFADFKVGLPTVFLSFARSLIGGFILALPVAFAFRR